MSIGRWLMKLAFAGTRNFIWALASKNPILIIEFARELEQQGRNIVQAACAVHRSWRGNAPCHGWPCSSACRGTLFGLVFSPVFYAALRLLVSRGEQARVSESSVAVADKNVR
ncbi:hypothetical protein NTD81_11315 [Pseudomonas sp. 5P_3.1_Bac2]|nr:hypothetical protein [Pseudomonas sp. 5P_3.1_Bac2]MCU1717705.1 hypothetical protein [Pseudomonas sp. 5P_3.1_Bac2]